MIDLSNSFIFPKGDKVEGENFKGEAWQERLVPMQSEWNCPIGSEDNMKSLCPDSTVLDGLTLHTGRDSFADPISEWLADIGVTE